MTVLSKNISSIKKWALQGSYTSSGFININSVDFQVHSSEIAAVSWDSPTLAPTLEQVGRMSHSCQVYLFFFFFHPITSTKWFLFIKVWHTEYLFFWSLRVGWYEWNSLLLFFKLAWKPFYNTCQNIVNSVHISVKNSLKPFTRLCLL